MDKKQGDQPQPEYDHLISQTIPRVQVKYGAYTFEITPFVSRTQEVLNYGYAHQGSVTKISLVGTLLTEDGVYLKGFQGLKIKKDALILAFSSDFQTLKVLEDGVDILVFDRCIIESVNFASSGNGIAAEYTINLKCYEKEYFTQNYGILNPSDRTSYNYNDNGTISIEHVVSAKGIFTGGSNKAIANAKNWVQARTNFDMGVDPRPILSQGFGGSDIDSSKITNDNCILISESKSVDRLEGTYSTTNQYLLQTGDLWNAPMIGGTVSEISTDVKSGINDDYVTVSVNYKLKGSQSLSASELRTKASQISPTGALWDIATGVEPNFARLMYPGGYTLGGPSFITEIRSNNYGYLPYLPDSISINDRADTNKEIEISCDFISSPDLLSGWGFVFDPSFEVSKNEITSEITVTMNGAIKGIGPRSYRNQVISGIHQNFSSMKGEYYTMCNEIYTGIYGTGAWLLNPFPTSHSVAENKFKGTLDVSYSFNNEDVPVTGGFPVAQSANFDITVAPSMQKYSAKADSTTRGLYAIYDLKVKTREQIDVSTTLNKYHEVDPLTAPTWGEDHRIHGHIITGYVQGPTSTRGVIVQEGKIMDKTWNVQGSPHNSVNLSSKHTQKLQRKQGTPFNG